MKRTLQTTNTCAILQRNWQRRRAILKYLCITEWFGTVIGQYIKKWRVARECLYCCVHSVSEKIVIKVIPINWKIQFRAIGYPKPY